MDTLARPPLVQKYASRHLSDLYGQKFVVEYFKAVARNPGLAFRNYVILGSHGVGKTTLVRSFANDLLGVEDARDTPNYVELDSYQVKDREKILALKDYIFTEVPGFKVVLLDEFHLIDQQDQAGFLKDIETCTLPIFFFFASTERDGILPTIFSRSFDFTLSKFTREELLQYANHILSEEGVSLSDSVLDVIVYRSFGHLRDLLNQIDLALFVGEELYVKETQKVFSLVQEFFSNPSKEVVSGLSEYPHTFIQECVDHFLHHRIIRGRELFSPQAIPQLFAFYLRFKRYLKSEGDYLSFLYLFSDHIASMRKQYGI